MNTNVIFPPSKFMHTTDISDPIEKIWDTLDGYTYEIQSYDEKKQKSWIPMIIPIPPVRYENKLVKGCFFSQAVDIIVENFPKIKELFFTIANSMCFSYPWADNADAMFVSYKNKEKEKYYLNKYKDRQGTFFIPLQDSDFTNEYKLAPTPNTLKTIDVLMVSTPYPVKNLPIFAKTLVEYEKLYNKRLKATLITGLSTIKKDKNGKLDYSELREDARKEMEKVEKILKNTSDYLNIIPKVNHEELPKYYTSAKCFVLTSLLEGKNRSISEALSCNTPVIVFKDFNKYIRAQDNVFFENSGEYVEHYDPVELAQTIHKVINNQKSYKARKNYLKYRGRKNFVNITADCIPYYKKMVPDYEDGKFYQNLWFDLAVQNNYQISYHDFLYEKNLKILRGFGLKGIEELCEFYFKKFKIK